MAINSRPRDGRSACWQLGFCFQGCKSGAKWSTLYTEIPKAEATGQLDLRPQSMVMQIQHDADGKVTGVLYADKDGKHQVQKARVVCVAGNSIETPRLLLNSASSKFPHGLANSSGQVGRNYMRHTTGSVYRNLQAAGPHVSRHRDGRDHPGRSATGYQTRIRRRLRDGDYLAGAALHRRLPESRRLGRDYTRLLEQYPNMAGMWIVGEDMPQENNAVTLHPTEKDQFGLPIPTCITTTTPMTSRCATTPTSRARRFTRRSARPNRSRCRPTRQLTTWAPAG